MASAVLRNVATTFSTAAAGGLVGYLSYSYGCKYGYKLERANNAVAEWLPWRRADNVNPLLVNAAINGVSIGKRRYPSGPFSTGDTSFAFGVNGGYTFGYKVSPTANKQVWFLPSSSYYNKCGLHVGTVYSTAISPAGDEFIAYWDKILNRASWVFARNSGNSNTPSYTSLITWLRKTLKVDEDALKHISVVFGSGSSCFAKTQDACYWQDLPMKLQSVLDEKEADYSTNEDHKDNPYGWIPRILALGGNETFIAIWEDGRFVTSLNTACNGYEDLSNEDNAEHWENIILSPHNQVDFFATMKSGSITRSYSRLDSSSAQRTMLDGILKYLQFRADADGSHFSMTAAKSGKILREISPNLPFEAG